MNARLSVPTPAHPGRRARRASSSSGHCTSHLCAGLLSLLVASALHLPAPLVRYRPTRARSSASPPPYIISCSESRRTQARNMAEVNAPLTQLVRHQASLPIPHRNPSCRPNGSRVKADDPAAFPRQHRRRLSGGGPRGVPQGHCNFPSRGNTTLKDSRLGRTLQTPCCI